MSIHEWKAFEHHALQITNDEILEWDEVSVFQQLARVAFIDPKMLAELKAQVRSKRAQYFILDAVLARSNRVKFQDALDVWKKEISGPLADIDREARSKFEKPWERAFWFAIRAARWLRTKFTEKITCEYSDGAVNFIRTLLTSGACQCLCFASYIVASAEEFGYEDYIRGCGEIGHISIALIRDPDETTYVDAQLEIAQVNVTLFQGIDNSESLAWFKAHMPTKLTKQVAISASLELSYDDDTVLMVFLSSTAGITPDGFSETFGVESELMEGQIVCQYNPDRMWSNVINLLYHAVRRKRKPMSLIHLAFAVGEIYELRDVVKCVLLEFLIMVEMRKVSTLLKRAKWNDEAKSLQWLTDFETTLSLFWQDETANAKGLEYFMGELQKRLSQAKLATFRTMLKYTEDVVTVAMMMSLSTALAQMVVGTTLFKNV